MVSISSVSLITHPPLTRPFYLDGNEYARNIAVKAEMYHTERMAWVAIRQQAQTDNAARVGLSGHAGSVSGLSGHASSEDGRMSLP